MNWKEEYINKFCTFEGENRMVFKNKITADESLNFIDQIISERDKEIRKEYVDYSTWTCGVCHEENLKGDPTKHKCWKILNDFYKFSKIK